MKVSVRSTVDQLTNALRVALLESRDAMQARQQERQSVKTKAARDEHN